MSELVVHEPLASQIRAAAQAEGVDAESLVETAIRHYRFEAQRHKVNAESAWWASLPPDERLRYADEFVAVHQRAVVDHDRDEESLRRRIRARYGKTAVLITPAQGRRELRFISPQAQWRQGIVGL